MNYIETVNPFSQEVIEKHHLELNPSHKVAKSRKVFNKWKGISVEQRIKILKKALEYFEIHKEQVARDITQQMGKPLSQALGEVNGLFERSDFLMKAAPAALKSDEITKKEGFERTIRHEPLGIVFVVAAWNYPLLIAINGVMASLLSGNSVLLKHSSNTLSIGSHFEKAFGNIEGYEGLLQSLVLSHSQTQSLIESQTLDHVIFTGSVGGGNKIYQSVSQGFMDCQLELGGKDGAYIAKDANVEQAAVSMVEGAMYNAGQSCCGIERVYAHQNNYEELVRLCLKEIDRFVLGDPMLESTTMGPLSSPNAAFEMQIQIEDALSKGAKVLRGGKVKKIGEAVFFEPTLLVDVDHSMRVMQEENFGPILPIMKVDQDAEALRLMNGTNFGLTAVIFSQDKENAYQWSEVLQAGTIFLNRCDYLDPELAWTGYKNSGKGSGLSKHCFSGVTQLKSIHFKIL